MQDYLVDWALNYPGVHEAYAAHQLRKGQVPTEMAEQLQKGYNYKRSGDVLLVLQPGWTDQMSIATTHGTGFSYDTHVPLLWYGAGIEPGQLARPVAITDIAPTLSLLLHTKLPSACTGEPIGEVLPKK
ncbi:MAG: hypothetical protein HC842_03720 [Cytophagales bacterium]|nr:hypothetical protein [Cytophagales bacterium]